MKKSIASLHVFIMLFALAVYPVSAVDSAPSMPLVLSGNIEIDGEPAPVGTEIVVKLNETIAGQTEVSLEGIYGNTPQNKLYITCSPEDYSNLKFYVNDVESNLVDKSILEAANAGDVISDSNILASAESRSSSKLTKSSSIGSSGGGGFGGYVESVEVPETNNVETGIEEENVSEENLKSPISVAEESAEEAPVPEKSSVSSIELVAIGLIIIIGAIATVKYKFQK